MIILVNGLIGDGSGKTILASSLVSILKKEGFDVVGFKPVGGTDIWLRPWVMSESRKRRLVVTGDGVILERVSMNVEDGEVLNPIAILLGYADPSRFAWKSSMLDRHLSSISDRSLIGRVTMCEGGNAYTTHFINASSIHDSPARIQAAILELAALLDPKPLRVERGFIEEILEGRLVDAPDSCLKSLLRKHEIIVVESNSDIAAPTHMSSRPDIVVTVAPGVASILSGSRFKNAIEVLAIRGRPWSVTTKEVVNITGVEKTIYLPLLEDPMEGYTYNDLEEIIDYIKSQSHLQLLKR